MSRVGGMVLAILPVLTGAIPAQERPVPPWVAMDYGPFFSASLQVARGNIAYKGIAVRLDPGPGGMAAGKAFALFDTDTLRMAAGWIGEGFIDWQGIAFNGKHAVHPSIVGTIVFSNPVGPGWANPQGGTWTDPRLRGRDKLPYGPLPRAWGRWKGVYLHGRTVVLSYTVGDAEILESPGFEGGALTRTLRIGPRGHDLTLQVAHRPEARPELRGAPANVAWVDSDDGHLRLRIPRGQEIVTLKLLLGGGPDVGATPPADLLPLTRGGPPRWTKSILTRAAPLGSADGPYAIESLTLPSDNPYRAWMRPGGFDFFKDGRRAAICTWNGDVWTVDGLGGAPGNLEWRRIAAGLFQPLGLKIVDETIYVAGRDQITRLHDLDGDGEADFYENFNNDHQVTEHFHEFAMDLQTDADGNFLYAKAARHALDSLVPQHGTLVRVSRDGRTSEIVCNGFRAPNGVGVGPGGELATSDQEGHWMPANRINLVRPGGFYGNMYSYHAGEPPKGYLPPVCWLPKNVDRSPAQQLWVAGDRWGPLGGKMLSLSYGTGQVFHVMTETVGSQVQGAAVKLPLLFPTGIMRGRFHAGDGQLYACGLFGWSSDRTFPGGFYRVRYTGAPLRLPVAQRLRKDGIELTFSEPLEPAAARDPDNYSVRWWNYRWTEKYGSDPYRVSDPKKTGQDAAEVLGAELLPDGKTVFLKIDGLRPVMQIEITFALRAADGAAFRQKVYGTINALPE